MMKTIQTNNFEETRKLGEEFAASLQGGDVLCLKGDLGAGKTTFMQGLAKGLGIAHRIISPTFIIMRTYDVPNTKYDITHLYHIDLYRTETLADMEGLGLPEILKEKDAVIAIEWSEKLGALLPKRRWDLDFTWISEDERSITIQQYE